MTHRECPKCGGVMELDRADPNVGVMSDAWMCSECGYSEIADDPDDPGEELKT